MELPSDGVCDAGYMLLGLWLTEVTLAESGAGFWNGRALHGRIRGLARGIGCMTMTLETKTQGLLGPFICHGVRRPPIIIIQLYTVGPLQMKSNKLP